MIIGTDYWRQLIDFIEQMAQRGKISSSDLQLIETFQRKPDDSPRNVSEWPLNP